MRRPAKSTACVVSHRDRLPENVQPVADLLGDRGLLALLEAHGGTRLAVPRSTAPFDPLPVLLGVAAAERLVREFGGATLTLAMCKAWRATLLRRQGYSYAAIGRRMGTHEYSVFRMLKRFDDHGGKPAGEKEAKRERANLRQLHLMLDEKL